MKLNFTYKKGHSLLLLLFIFGFSSQANATPGVTYYARVTGLWSANTTWSLTSGGTAVGTGITPGAADTVIIDRAVIVSISQNTNVSCAAITISTGGQLAFVTASPNSNSLTCSGTFTCGTSTTKGTLTMVNGSKLTCQSLVVGTGTGGNASVIAGRNGATSSSFVFTGTGTTVVPVLTGDTTTLPDFNDVTFNLPTKTSTVTVPLGFSSKTLAISQGIVDFSTNYNTTFTGGTSLTMLGDTYLKIGGTNQLPYNSYTLNATSTIDFTGAIQDIRALPFPDAYANLTLSGPGIKSLRGDVNIALTLTVATGVTLNIGAGNTLSLNGTYVNSGTGCVRGSKTSNLWYKGYADSTFNFDQVTANGNTLNNVSVGLSAAEGGLTPSTGNNLDLIVGNKLDIYGIVTLTSGHLNTNDFVTLKSDASTTAIIAQIVDPTITGITGNVTVERWVPAGTDNGTASNLGRGYRALSSSVTGGTVFTNWQEGGSVASLTGSISGNTLYTLNPSTPLVVGQHISGNLIPANTTISDISSAPNYQLSISQNTSSSIAMIAYTSISSSTIEARFMGHISNNSLTVDSFTQGTTLNVGQKITAGGLVLANTVITAKYAGNSSYKIGLEIPSETMYYNGALAGFGTQISGKACTDAQLGQVDATTGVDLTRSGNPSLFSFDNTLQQWTAITNTKTQNITAGNPYLLMVRGDRTIDLALNSSTPTNTTLRSTGTIVAGDQDVSSSLNTTTASLNYIGNPYQAPVDLKQMLTDGLMVGLEQSYTVFDSTMNTRGAYVTVDLTDGSNTVGSVVNGTVQPNQAFFVRTADNSVSAAIPTLTFQEFYKVTTDNTYVPVYRKAQSTTSKINGAIYNTTDSTKALDGFSLSFSDNYTNKILAEDAIKPTGNQDEIFASVNGATNMAIDKRNFPAANDEIPLYLTQERLSNYILKFSVANFDAKNAYLVDTYTAKETPLPNSTTSSYAFSVDTAIPASTAANRFKIVFKTATPLNTISNSINKFTVYPNPVIDNKFTVKANQDFNGKTANLSIVNTIGQAVYNVNTTFSNDGSIAVNPTNSLNKGVYFLKITVDGKVETKKLIIK